jgi:serine/threonine-protein kinase
MGVRNSSASPRSFAVPDTPTRTAPPGDSHIRFEPATGGWSAPPLLRDDPTADAPIARPNSPDLPAGGADRLQVLGEIARGGMGVVLKARDPDLGRDLAVKVLRLDQADNATAVQRFVEEAQVSGQLQHPGIVPVYDLGRFADGRPFFSMKLVKGQTLSALLADRPAPTHDRGRFLQVFGQIAQTVAYAHAKGVIHRDLKPANVMVGAFGEVLVMDWGLAKVLPRGGVADEERALTGRIAKPADDEPSVIHTARTGSGPGSGSETVAGSVLGTLSFMPPEQAGGEVDKLDERADVFGLGAILCVVLTGAPPYVGDTAEKVRLLAVRGKLADAFARLDGCGADAELVALCKRCLAPEREDRPRHAGEVAAAVAGYLGGVEERARRAEVDRAAADARAAEQRRKRKYQAGLAAAAVLQVGLAGAGAVVRQNQRAERAREEVARREQDAAKLAQAEQAVADADAAVRAGRPADARAALEKVDGLVAGLPDPGPAAARAADLRRDLALLAGLELAVRDARLSRVEGDVGEADRKRVTAKLTDALRAVGVDPAAQPPEAVAAALAARPTKAEVQAALLAWRRLTAPPADDPLAVAAAKLDPAPDQQADAVAKLVAAGDADGLAKFTAGLDPAAVEPAWAVTLAWKLDRLGRRQPAVAFLDRVLAHRPDNYPALIALLDLHWTAKPAAWPAIARLTTAAAGLRPTDPLLAYYHGCTLRRTGDPVAAVEPLRRAVALDPKQPYYHNELGETLYQLGRVPEAMISFARSARVSTACHSCLVNYTGLVRKEGKLAATVAEVAAEVAAAPADLFARTLYGYLLIEAGRPDDALAEFRAVNDRQPHAGLYGIGYAYRSAGRLDEAIGTFTEVVKHAPGDDNLWFLLGNLLRYKARFPEAVEAYKRALALNPKFAWAADNMGFALKDAGRLEEAIAACQQAVANGRAVAQRRVDDLKGLAALDPKLTAVRGGSPPPTDPDQLVRLARLCYYRKCYALGADLFAAARAAGWKDTATYYRPEAAATAARAGLGEGDPAAPPADRPRYRKQAHALLTAQFVTWQRSAKAGTGAEAGNARRAFRYWLDLPDFARLREPAKLAALPAAERAEWEALWAKVRAAVAELGKVGGEEV